MDSWDFVHSEIRRLAPDASWIDGEYAKLLDELSFEVKAFLGVSHNTSYGDVVAKMKAYELDAFKRRLKGINVELWKKYRFRVNLTRLDGLATLCDAHIYELFKRIEERITREFTDYMEKVRRLNLWAYGDEHDNEDEDGFDFESLFKKKWYGKTFHGRLWHGFSFYMMTLKVTLGKEFALGHGHKLIMKALSYLNDRYKNTFIRFYKTEPFQFANNVIEREYHLHNVKDYIYNASPNESKCVVCGGLDRTKHQVANILVGANYPTMHPRCDCLTRPSLYLPQEKPFAQWEKLIFGK